MSFRPLGLGSLYLAAACTASTVVPRSPVRLAITHASVLDVRTGHVLPDRTVLVDHDSISALLSESDTLGYAAARILDAHGRLLTPAFIDCHFHTGFVFADSLTNTGGGITHLVMQHDSIEKYRRTVAGLYMPYGVTVVRDVGSAERDLPMLIAWMKRSPNAPDFYPVGAQLVSPESGRVSPPFQAVLADSEAAARKVQEYYRLGIRNIKLYWRLRAPEFRVALHEAQKLGMNVTGHVDQQVMTIDQGLDLGLRNFEHLFTFAMSTLTEAELDSLYASVPAHLGVTRETASGVHGLFFLITMEFWNYVGPDNPRMLALIAKFKADDASLTPTLHVIAERLHLTYFTSPPHGAFEDESAYTPQQKARALEGYRIMVSYVRRLYEDGIRLNLGTDTHDPGKAILSEMLLLHEAGMPMTAVFKVATLNGAQDIGQGPLYGSIEVGKRADLILFEHNPLEDPRNLLGTKTIVKDGVVWSSTN
jgi:imidazolonepropionase-like amidohydrolase